MNTEAQVLEDSIFKIGKVVSVDGRIVRIKVDKSKNSSHLLYKGELLKNISVGGYIKIAKGFTRIVGKVEGEFTSEDPLYSKKEYGSEREKINRILAVSLLGFLKGDEFERGIKELPLVGNECFLLKNDEFNQVHDFLRDDDEPITIGKLSLEKGQDIKVGINSLFASHIGIFGNTGSGKSYTLAKIYRELFERYKDSAAFKENAEFFLIDFNGEYIQEGVEEDNIIVERRYKNLYCLSTRSTTGDKFPVKKEALGDSNFWVVFLEATEKTQAPFLRRAIEGGWSNELFENLAEGEDPNVRLRDKFATLIDEVLSKKDEALGVKILIELFSDLYQTVSNRAQVAAVVNFLNERLGFNTTSKGYYVTGVDVGTGTHAAYSAANIDEHFRTPVRTLIDGLNFHAGDIAAVRLKIILKYYDEIIKGHSNRDHLSPLIKRLEGRITDLAKVIGVHNAEETRQNFTIISLRDVNVHIRKVLPLLLCRNLYEEKKKTNDGKSYLNIIIDEAHNILSSFSERESEQWKDYRLETFEEIIKEGRKFGVFLTIASQRPADISPTILSQLHNYFLHRLINNNDIIAVEKTISYLDKVSFDYLPILPRGTCILAGLLAQVPVVVDIGSIPPDFEPKNKTMTLADKWSAH